MILVSIYIDMYISIWLIIYTRVGSAWKKASAVVDIWIFKSTRMMCLRIKHAQDLGLYILPKFISRLSTILLIFSFFDWSAQRCTRCAGFFVGKLVSHYTWNKDIVNK